MWQTIIQDGCDRMTKVVYCNKHYLDVVLSEGKCFRCLDEEEEEE